jgi:hypothetical protein
MTTRITPQQFLTLVLGLYSLQARSQTLSCQSNCPQAGEVYSIRTSSPVISQPGANQVWNFSGIDAVSPVTHLISYDPATAVAAGSLYPQANLVKTASGNTSFLTAGSAGIRAAYASSVNANAGDMLLPLPFAYGDTYTETIIASSVVGTDTFVTTTKISYTAHATGTVILPSGTFTDVLAIKFRSNKAKTKNGNPYGFTIYNETHFFYTPGIHHPLIYSRYMSDSGQMDYGPYTEFIDQVVVGIKDENAEVETRFAVFPNPATNLLHVKCSTNSKNMLRVTDATGQIVIKKEIEGGDSQLDISGLSNGIYFISLNSDRQMISKKFVVAR